MSNAQHSHPGLSRPDPESVAVTGPWRVLALSEKGVVPQLQSALAGLPTPAQLRWDLSGVSSLDHVGAQWLWDAWGRKRPRQLLLSANQEEIFAHLEEAGALQLPKAGPRVQAVE